MSRESETDVEALIIQEGWLLMTCSGTIGRVFYVPKRLDGWAATHDLIRIVPYDKNITGFLLSWLTHGCPVKRSKITVRSMSCFASAKRGT